MTEPHVAVVFNEPCLPVDHPDHLAEADVVAMADSVAEALGARGFSATTLGLGRTNWYSRLHQLDRGTVLFNLIEGLAGVAAHEPRLTGIFDLLGFSYTGSPAETLALVRDKTRVKWLLRGANLPTAATLEITANAPFFDVRLASAMLEQGPLFVKPAAEDASQGITNASVVTTVEALKRQVSAIRQQYGQVLVEQFINGREFNITVAEVPPANQLENWLRGDQREINAAWPARVFPPAEILFSTRPGYPWPIMTYDAKWHIGSDADLATTPHCPAEITDELRTKILHMSLEAFRVAGCRDYARIDFRVDRRGQPYILEINGNPDISPHTGVARSAHVDGVEYGAFLAAMVNNAAQRRVYIATNSTTHYKNRARSNTARKPILMRDLRSEDVSPILELLRACGNFRPDEVAVAEEILVESLEHATRPAKENDYCHLVAEVDQQVAGWSCYGLTPLTDGIYDLYWIAVDPRVQGAGVGGAMLRAMEQHLANKGGRWLLAETSGLPNYELTRRFYLVNGFEILNVIDDFYRTGDARFTFGKRVDRALPNFDLATS